MTFINQIPTNVPGLTHLAAVNDKVLKPGLGVAQTAKGYYSTMRKDKTKDQTQHIVIETISQRDTPRSDWSDTIDHEYSDSGKAERERVQQLMAPRSLDPSFPNRLPKRPSKKEPVNRWKIGFFGMLLVFAAAVIPLAILATRNTGDCDPNQPVRQSQATVTATSTQESVSTATTTRVTVSISTSTDVRVKTTMVTDVAKVTGLGDALKGGTDKIS